MSYKCCANCKYANTYIPLFSYPHSVPYCDLGHGLCREDKSCDDFSLIGRLSR